MTTYPIKVSSLSLDHRGGTKSYHIYVIETADNRAVFVNRWGKTGQFGELQTKEFPDVGLAWKEWNGKEQQKTHNGYYPKGSTRVETANSQDELKAAMGLALFNKIGKVAILHLDPTFDVSGMRDADPPRTSDGDTKIVNDTARRADISEALAAQAEEEKKKVAKVYADNPVFGRF